MSANPIYITQALTKVECANCSIAFGISERFERERRKDHNNFYCPNGHSNYFPGESDVEKVERLRKQVEWQLQQKREECERQRQETYAIRKRHFNLKQRIRRGKCPVKHCKEKFLTVKEHLKKHKRFK